MFHQPTVGDPIKLRQQSEASVVKSGSAVSELHDALAMSMLKIRSSWKRIEESDLLISDIAREFHLSDKNSKAVADSDD